VSTVTINRNHELGPEACEEALDELEAYLASDLGARVTRLGTRLSFAGPGFDGSVLIEPGTAYGQIKLGFLARPFKRQLEQEINRQLDARLGA
jgi:putative polyhydroxyalkanoate system protein